MYTRIEKQQLSRVAAFYILAGGITPNNSR